MTRDSDLYGLMVDLEQMLTPGEAAKMIGVDAKTLVRWANSDKIRCHKTLGGHRRFRLEDVLKVIHGANGLGEGVQHGKSRVASG